MFYECKSLKILDLISFNTKDIIKMDYMFYNCSSLIIINLSSFNDVKAGIRDIFNGCKNLSYYCSSDKDIVDAFNNK